MIALSDVVMTPLGFCLTLGLPAILPLVLWPFFRAKTRANERRFAWIAGSAFAAVLIGQFIFFGIGLGLPLV